jgi:hypothetical protein
VRIAAVNMSNDNDSIEPYSNYSIQAHNLKESCRFTVVYFTENGLTRLHNIEPASVRIACKLGRGALRVESVFDVTLLAQDPVSPWHRQHR